MTPHEPESVPAQSFSNQFLVALANLSGDYFQNTITLLIEHSEKGAFGLVINRPMEYSLQDVLPKLPSSINCPLMEGGPVERDKIFFLHGPDQCYESTLTITPEIFLTTSEDLLNALHEGHQPEPMLALLGYAGWGANQLERELGENTWLLTPSSARILFHTPNEQKNIAAAKLLGVDLNLIATKAGHD